MKHKNLNFLKNEYIYSVLMKFITIAVGLAQSILIARFLGAELKGVHAYIHSITSIGSIVITFGMQEAYPYFRKKQGKEAVYQDFVSLTMLLYAVYLAIGVVLACALPVSIELKASFVLIPLLGYSRVVGYVTLVERPNLRNTWWTVITIADVAYIGLLWLLVERNIYWTISILLFADLMKSIVYTVMLHVRPRLHKGLFRWLVELGKFGFFPMVALLMTTLNYRIDVLMLHQYDHITDAMIGIYSLGLSLSDKIILIPDTLKGVLISKLAKGADNHEVAKVSRISFWASALLCAAIFALGKIAIRLFYGAEYEGAYSVVLITSVGILAVGYFKLIVQYNVINKRQKLNVLMLSIAIVTDVVLNLLFIPSHGIQGAAIATSIGNVVCGGVFIAYFCYKTKIRPTELILLQKSDLALIKGLLGRFGKKTAAKKPAAQEEPPQE